MSHSDLVKAGHKWLLGFGCAFAFMELHTMCDETPDVIGFKWGNTILIECKTSRSDFFADRKKVFRKIPAEGLGRYRFMLCPKGMIKVEELPRNWGLLYIDNNKVGIEHNPYCKSKKGNILKGGFYKRNKEGEFQLMYSALRRLQVLKLVDRIYKVKSKRR